MIIKALNHLYQYFPPSLKHSAKHAWNWYHYYRKNPYFSVRREKNIYTVTAPFGEMRFYHDPYKEFCVPLRGYLFGPVRPQRGDVIVDGGAFPGDFMACASLIGSKVFAFEPDPENYEYILRIIELNKLDNVIPINKGIWRQPALLPFSFDGFRSGISGNGERIRVTSIDEELSRYNIQADFIKMDIQGAEIDALGGCQAHLNRGARFAIASYHIVDSRATSCVLQDLFAKNGYNAVTQHPEHLTTYASRAAGR